MVIILDNLITPAIWGNSDHQNASCTCFQEVPLKASCDGYTFIDLYLHVYSVDVVLTVVFIGRTECISNI